jgi:hypothetical protein
MDLFESFRQELDPLDMEILERAFDAALAVVKEDHPTQFDSDEGLEAILRRELIEIACFNCVSDPEALRELVVTTVSSQTGGMTSDARSLISCLKLANDKARKLGWIR